MLGQSRQAFHPCASTSSHFWSVCLQGAEHVRAYFPQGMWYSLWDHSSRIDASRASDSCICACQYMWTVHVSELSLCTCRVPSM